MIEKYKCTHVCLYWYVIVYKCYAHMCKHTHNVTYLIVWDSYTITEGHAFTHAVLNQCLLHLPGPLWTGLGNYTHIWVSSDSCPFFFFYVTIKYFCLSSPGTEHCLKTVSSMQLHITSYTPLVKRTPLLFSSPEESEGSSWSF